MKTNDYALQRTVPAYGTIKRGMQIAAKQQAKKSAGKKKKNLRLTEISRGSGKAILRDGVAVNRGIKKLYDYEETGLSPHEIMVLIEREQALTEKVKKMQDW
jgi:hypothetical protein